MFIMIVFHITSVVIFSIVVDEYYHHALRGDSFGNQYCLHGEHSIIGRDALVLCYDYISYILIKNSTKCQYSVQEQHSLVHHD